MDIELTKHRIDDAMRIANGLLQSKPTDSTLPMILEQLAYLNEVYDRDHNFRTVPVKKMTLGVIAAREYDTVSPDFADLLCKISLALDHQN
jgi:hypothetical protein